MSVGPFPVPSQGYWLNRKQPVKPSLTTSVAVLSFGSQIWEAREPGSLCSSPCLEQCSGKLRMKEHQGKRKRQALTHLALSAGTGYKNNTTPLGEAHLPATLPHHQFAASNRAGWLAGWLGWEEMTTRQTTGKSPHTCHRESHFKWAWTSGFVSCREVSFPSVCKVLSKGLLGVA